MKSCSLSDFLKALEPWLSKDYIRSVRLDENGYFILFFVDGVSNTYRIDDCNQSQFENIILQLKKKGIPIYK
jgi:hypothetical protein